MVKKIVQLLNKCRELYSNNTTKQESKYLLFKVLYFIILEFLKLTPKIFFPLFSIAVQNVTM